MMKPLWDRLSERELQQFLVANAPLPYPLGADLKDRAQLLFDHLQTTGKGVYPNVILDLIIASQLKPSLENTKSYTFEQIQNLTDDQIQQFRTSFGDNNLDKSRIFQILYFLDLVEEGGGEVNQEMLLQPDILAGICQHLTFEEANKLRINSKMKNLNCRVSIIDRDNQVSSLPGVNSDTISLYRQLKEKGAEYTLNALIGDHMEDKNFQRLQILIPEMRDLNYPTVYPFPLIYTSSQKSFEILEILLKNGLNPNLQDNNGYTLIWGASTAAVFKAGKSTRKIIQLLLDYGADPTLPSPNYGSSLINYLKDYSSASNPHLSEVIQMIKENIAKRSNEN